MLSIEQIAFAMPSISKAADSARSNGMVLFPTSTDNKSAQLLHDDSLVDNGDGTFTFTSKISAAYSYSDTSKSRLQTADGYYTFEKPGTYLIELWGGDGGDGGRAFLSGRNGIGGKGGFVYGTLNVTADNGLLNKRLYYEIGSKGESETIDMTAGGNAGVGGGAGEIALVDVGAGGGYSAVYLLDYDPANNIEETIGEDPPTAPDTPDPEHNLRDNTGKVLMIAGGGGGGAAGANGFHLTALVLKMHGDGGNGGSLDSSIYAQPNIGSFTTGMYYAGENGTSSGGKTSYVGQGGTDRPEGLAKTTIGYMTASTYANDWQRTYHPELLRGVGGAGNLHGGGGGAGFAGGGGGIQNVILDANNVGGGGGGSSYTAASYDEGTGKGIKGFTAFPTLTTEQRNNYFIDKDGNTNADTGGAIYITYLEDNSNYYDYLKNVEISGEVSQYFDIVDGGSHCKNYKYKSADSNETENPDVNIVKDNTNPNKFTITGSLEPIRSGLTKGQAHDTLTLTLKLKPKTGFAGGNNVPIFDTTTTAFTCVATSDSNKTCTFLDTADKQKDVSHVNVKLNVEYSANSLVLGVGETYEANSLKNTTVTYDSVNPDPMHAFITGISYEVLDKDNNDTPFTTSYTVQSTDKNTTKNYTVKATITPNSNQAAKVGDAGDGIIEKTAKVKCVEESPLEVDGFYVYAKKLLSYNETYDLDLDLKFESKPNTPETNKSFYVYDPINYAVKSDATSTIIHGQRDNSVSTNDYQDAAISVDLEPGYYFIEAWGADGGTGGPDTGIFNSDGGVGGKGAYKSGYIYLSSSKTASIRIGLKGYSGNSWWVSASNSNRAYGGGHSEIIIDDNIKLIAGGGGGGSIEGAQPQVKGYDADASGHTADTNYGETSITIYNAIGTKNRVPGNGGKSEVKGLFTDPLPSYIDSTTNGTLQHETTGNGSVRITKLGVKGGYGYGTDEPTSMTETNMSSCKTTVENGIRSEFANKIKDFDISETFSEYFDVNNCTVVNAFDSTGAKTIEGHKVTVNVDLPASSIIESQGTPDLNYSPIAGYTTTKTTYNYKIEANGNVKVKLKPKDGFLGGNDVPLLDEVTNAKYTATPIESAVKIEHHNTTTDDDDVDYVRPNELTDYANVEIDNSGVKWVNQIGGEQKALPTEVIVPYGKKITEEALDSETGESITFAPTATDPTDNDPATCEDAYVDRLTTSIAPALNSPVTQDTTYTLSAELKPTKLDTPNAKVVDAVVRESMPEKITKAFVNVHVQYSVSNNGTGIVVDKKDDKFILDQLKNDGGTYNDYVIKITPADGYTFPLNAQNKIDVESLNIVVDGVYNDGRIIEPGDDNNSIIVTISPDKINNNIVISGSASPKTYKLHYYYEVYDKNSKQILYNDVIGGEFSVGQSLENADPAIAPPFNPDFATESDKFPVGCDGYLWTWGNGKEFDPSDMSNMDSSDMYLFGRYLEKTYTLTINYYKIGYESPFKVYTSPQYSSYNEETGIYEMALKAGSQYYVVSPQVEGYYADKPVVAGEIAKDATSNPPDETVTYSQLADDDLIIYQIECDKYGVPTGNSRIENSINLDLDKYEILEYTHYKKIVSDDDPPKTSYVEEIVDGIGTEGIYYVYYREKLKRVNITFYPVDPKNQPSEEKPSDSTKVKIGNTGRQFAVGREYSYDPNTDRYVGLPSAVCDGYIFVGWYDSQGNPVNDEALVPDRNDIELYAHWKPNQVTITVDYLYSNDIENESLRGTRDGDPVTTSIEYYKKYTVTKAVPTGYVASENPVTGIALEDETRYVYYSDETKPSGYKKIVLTAKVYSKSFDQNNDGVPDAGAPLLSEGTYALFNDQGVQLGTAKQNKDGTVSWTSIETAIENDGTYKIVCEEPPRGYRVDEKQFTIDLTGITPKVQDGVNVYEYTVNIFLDKSPFQLPMAGSKPMTGYTVFGISAMLLAGLLMFAYVSRRTEEENENE